MNELYFSPKVQADLEEIKAYITEELENPDAAISTVSLIIKRLLILQTHAFVGAPLSSVVDVESSYRFIVCGNYLSFYHVHGNKVYIDRILYKRRDYLSILFGNMETT